jgi:nucleotide-binding universal stress UspA family protein
LVNAYSMPVDVHFYSYQAAASSQPVDWLSQVSRQLLDAAAARVRELAPDLECTQTSEMGPPAVVLCDASRGADAVVVGRRGLGATASAVLGSVSNRLSVEASCPLVVVGEGEQPTSGPIVVGVDDSEFGAVALGYALAEAALRQTSVRAVTAYDLPDRIAATDPELATRMRADLEGEAADVITRALAACTETPVYVDQVTVAGHPAEAILDHAGDAQLIVVGTHGKGLVRRVLLGSVSRRILNDADRPVALIDLPQR